MTDAGGGETRSTISAGAQGVVFQGRDFTNVTVNAPPVSAAPVALSQLPALVTEFAGRNAELAQIAALLDPRGGTKTAVVSALAGLAGVGKTALALQAAHAAREAGWFPGGMLFIDLHGYDDAPVQPDQALDALLRALGVPAEHIPPGAEERAALYRSALAQISDSVLLIADNASAEAQVELLLPGPGPHRVIVTSRHTLASLRARLLDVTVLDEEAAVALLNLSLQDARPGDARITADRSGAERLVGMCGGLPLALQITAALLKADTSRAASEVADELDEIGRLEALRYDDGSGTSAPSVAAAFGLSYRRLDETAAQVFRLLPVNPGPDVSTAAAAALADRPMGEIRRLIGRLAKAHLVEAAPGAAGRWQMHDLLRLYARQLSDTHAEADGQEQARDRLLDYYLDTAKAAGVHLGALPRMHVPAEFSGRDSALAWLDAERPNLIAAVTMAASTGHDEIAVSLSLRLASYLTWRRRFDDLVFVSVIGRDAARRLGVRSSEAAALGNLGTALKDVRRFEEAIAAHQEARVIFRETGDRYGEGRVLNNLGNTLLLMRRFEEAIAAHREAAARYREADDRHGEGITLDNLGVVLKDVRRFEEAIAAHQEARAIFRETGDRYGEGMALGNLGGALVGVGKPEDAITVYQQEQAICGEIGDRHGEGMALDGLGIALRDVGRFEEAITALQEARAIHREAGDRDSEARVLDNLGVALRRADRVEEAIAAHQEARATYREVGDRHGEGITLDNLGSALAEVGRVEEAIAAHQEARARYREVGDRHGEGITLNNLGLALRKAGRVEEAITAHQEARAIFRETGDGYGEGAALTNLRVDRVLQQMLEQRQRSSDAAP
jgi:tetratricopeptide (TPR) repeat protein